MEAKYKVGDTVYIKRNLKFTVSSDYSFGINENMLNLMGNMGIITFVSYIRWRPVIGATTTATDNNQVRLGNNIMKYGYRINLDYGDYNWEEEMFEDIKEIRKKKIEKLNGSKI